MGRAVVLAVAAFACVGCADGGTAKPTQPPDLYVLTAANELVGATAEGRVVARRQLARARRGTSPARRLALDGKRVFVVVRRDAPPDRIVVLDAATAEVRSSRTLPADIRARVVVAGSGRVFVAGNRAARRIAPDLVEEDAVVLELDRSGGVVRRFTVREANGRDWSVAAAALARDGRILVLSYHGGCDERALQLCTGGADLVDVEAGERRACREPYPGSGCLPAHGQVEFDGDELLAASGSPEILRLDADGRELGKLDTGLGNSHVMHFAFDRARRELVVPGPCQHFGGIAAVTLDDRRFRLLVRPEGPGITPVCGDRVSLLGTLAAVAPIRTAAADPSVRSRILLVDRATGQVRARVPLRAEAVDVLAVRSSG